VAISLSLQILRRKCLGRALGQLPAPHRIDENTKLRPGWRSARKVKFGDSAARLGADVLNIVNERLWV